ncbi:MAG: hypothetical protein L3J97_02575, partial [Thermoplasmata archaeon]|nr:hypothetical protein [Thermoplasmata archaeon]
MTEPLPESASAVPGELPMPPPPPVLSLGRTIAVLAALMSGLLLGALDNFIVATALPNIAAQLNDRSGVVFVVSS